jgi:predicted PurR-regulated permease PerM
MNLLPSQQRGGPVVWSGIIAATCVLLFLLQQMLFLAIPFLLGIVLYYILQPPCSAGAHGLQPERGHAAGGQACSC